jgi:hypothetical protein
MSLLFGVAANVMNSTQSNYALLQRFYEIDKEIEANEEKSFDLLMEHGLSDEVRKERTNLELQRLFLTVEAKTILKKLNII